MDLMLKDRVALVAASSQGLGFSTALQLSREGAFVALCSRDEARINAAVDAIKEETGNPVLGIRCDVTKPDEIQAMIDKVVDEWGGIDILVTNSGGPHAASFEDITDEEWHAAVDLVLMSTVRLIRSTLPWLRQSTAPAVLTITSISVKQPISDLILSNSIRMANIGITKTLAIELGEEGIRFNSILPSWTETQRVQDLLEERSARNKTSLEEEVAEQIDNVPLGRMGTPEEFGNVAAFLVSPAASYLNGVMLPIDGGGYKGVF